jgi:hypothetical protein
MSDSDVREITRRLDVIANLLTTLVAGQEATPSVSSRIEVLSQAGLGPADIGRVIGKSRAYVGAVLSQKKKAASGRARGGSGNAGREAAGGDVPEA